MNTQRRDVDVLQLALVVAVLVWLALAGGCSSVRCWFSTEGECSSDPPCSGAECPETPAKAKEAP